MDTVYENLDSFNKRNTLKYLQSDSRQTSIKNENIYGKNPGKSSTNVTRNSSQDPDSIYGNIQNNPDKQNGSKIENVSNKKTLEYFNDECKYENLQNLPKYIPDKSTTTDRNRSHGKSVHFPEDTEVEYGNIGGIPEEYDSGDSIDDFDSDDDWDDDIEQIDYSNSTIKVDSISLEEILKISYAQNLNWKQLMQKLQVNIKRFNEREILLQEAKFELVTAEYSFFKAMNILYGQFVEKLFIVLSKNEENKLFGFVKQVKDCSEKLLKHLEKSWQNYSFNNNFCDIICKFFEKDFDVYASYHLNQVYSEAILGEILSDKNRTLFKELLDDIQKEPICNGLHLHAYQLIPIRKINNFPNLLKNILKYLTPHDMEFGQCQHALQLADQLLKRCNEETKEARNHIRTKNILEKLEFPKNSMLKLNNSGNIHMRKFIKSDKMELVEMNSTLFGKRVTKKTVFVFLFNDILVVARKSNSNKYAVLDYCFRINLELDTKPIFVNLSGSIDLNTILYLKISENRELKPTEMILSCKTETNVIRWTEALDPSDSTVNKSKYNFIKKVIVQRNYSAVHSDEISLTIGEIYTILRETEDGWSFGQREKDSECGWFLTENVLLVDDIKQRVSNVKQKYNK